MAKDMSTSDGYICTLNDACLRQAREELNEIDADRLSAVEALRSWIKSQEHLRCRTGKWHRPEPYTGPGIKKCTTYFHVLHVLCMPRYVV